MCSGSGADPGPFDRRRPPQLSDEASAFFGGILSHLPALLPFTAPSPGAAWGSYARLRPGCWAGAFACWGWDNREAPLRATRPGGAESTNVEYKALDGTANPYVALAALVCAGLAGLAEGCRLPPPVQFNPDGPPPPVIGGSGGGGSDDGGAVVAPAALPGSLGEALAAWERDAALRGAVTEGLGAPLVRAFMAVRAGELEADPSLAHVLLRY
jgi:glutamine synthetase